MGKVVMRDMNGYAIKSTKVSMSQSRLIILVNQYESFAQFSQFNQFLIKFDVRIKIIAIRANTALLNASKTSYPYFSSNSNELCYYNVSISKVTHKTRNYD